jgi:hypothetical protein
MTTLRGAGLGGWLVRGGVGGVAWLALVGCAAPTTALRPTAGDMRGNAIVWGREAQPLVTGPMKLLHVNSDGRTEPRFSRVWRPGALQGGPQGGPQVGPIDCHDATPLSWDGESAVEIAKDELVCVSADGPARLSWHGRAVAPERVFSAPRQASLR